MRPVICLGLLVLLLAGAHAADIRWRSQGPGGGGWIQSIACDPRSPDLLYAGCDVGGLFVSTDAGRSWTASNEGLNDLFVQCIAVHPSDGDTLLLGLEGGVFKSTDGGKTWAWKRQGFPEPQRYSFSAPVGALCFDPTRPDVLYAGIGRPRWGKDGAGAVYRSEDCGENWLLVTDGALPSDAIVRGLSVSPDGRYVLVATDKGLFRSDDQGVTWQRSAAGLPHDSVGKVAVAPSDPAVAYCTLLTTARGDEPWNGGVYRSEDGGRNWQARSAGLATRVGKPDEAAQMTSNYREIVIHPKDAGTLYVGDWAWVSAGVYKTVDGGEVWRKVTDHHTQGRNMQYGWITNWGPSVECLAISAAAPERVVFGTSGHVFLTDDAGATWDQRYCREWEDGRLRGIGLEVTCLFGVFPDPVDTDRVYFGFYDIGLLVSDDRGETFRTSREGMRDAGNCFAMAFDPDDQAKLWAATGQWGSNRGFVCRSTDRGQNWTVVGQAESGLPLGQIRTLLVDPDSPAGRRTLYVTCNGHGVFRSEDDGSTWQAAIGGLPEGATSRPCGLAMDPENPAHLRLALGGHPGVGSGVYETSDRGATWTRLSGDGTQFGDVQALVASPADFDTLYVCQRERYERALDPPQLLPGGLFVSEDGGRTWERLNDYHFASCLAVSPVDPRVLYLGTTDHPYHDANAAAGLLRSADGGKTWHAENSGLPNTHVSCIAVDRHEPWRLYLGTGGNGPFVGIDTALAVKMGVSPETE